MAVRGLQAEIVGFAMEGAVLCTDGEVSASPFCHPNFTCGLVFLTGSNKRVFESALSNTPGEGSAALILSKLQVPPSLKKENLALSCCDLMCGGLSPI